MSILLITHFVPGIDARSVGQQRIGYLEVSILTGQDEGCFAILSLGAIQPEWEVKKDKNERQGGENKDVIHEERVITTPSWGSHS